MGFWLTGCKRHTLSIIHKCVTCRRQRGRSSNQKMSDWPADLTEPGQPTFTSVGVDIFGPWEVVTRRTRGVPANSKRWAAMFTCLVTRTVHIEVVEDSLHHHSSMPWNVLLPNEEKLRIIVQIEEPTLLVPLTLFRLTQSAQKIPPSWIFCTLEGRFGCSTRPRHQIMAVRGS